ncbi:MAG: DUF2252 domain-containing protein [Actinomycetota bacterium]
MARATEPTPTVRERIESGREIRGDVPIESHAEIHVDGRPDPIGLLTAQDELRLASLVPIRHARMGVSAFTFYRGGAAIMASDLSRGPTVGLRVQLCGDAHLSNFGVFFAADRRLVFDLTDCDETSPVSLEWALTRLVASVAVAGRDNDLSEGAIRQATRAVTAGYREVLDRSLTMSPLDLHYERVEIEKILADDEKLRKRSRKTLAKATRKDSMRALRKLTEEVDGERRIISQPPLIVPLAGELDDDDRARMHEFFEGYRSSLPPHRAAVLDRYRFVDLAHKVVGVGSVGTRCMIVLLESVDGSPLFLQFKEATTSVLEPFAGPSGHHTAGERVVRGQRALQTTGDVLLGWSRMETAGDRPVDYYFRQLWDGKGSAEVEEMGPKRMRRYARTCGATLALAHARTGDGPAIAGYLGDDADVDDVFAEFADRYADLNERDHAAHVEAVAAGRITASS